MGSLYRSEPMKLCQMIIAKESCYDIVGQLGKLNSVQFNDLNTNIGQFSRTFVNQVRRCEELERKLRFLERQVVECVPEIEPEKIDMENLETPTLAEVNQLEVRLDELEKNFSELNTNDCQLRKNLNECKEKKGILYGVEDFFKVVGTKVRIEANIESYDEEQFAMSFSMGMNPQGTVSSGADIPLTPLLSEETSENAWFTAGVIPSNKKVTFERVLWRACRKTVFVWTSEEELVLDDPVTLEKVRKVVFLVFFKGESLKQIIDKVCDGFNAHQYPCPKTSAERQISIIHTTERIKDLEIVTRETARHRYERLKGLASDLPKWLKAVHMQKSIYHVMNKFTVDTNGFLAAECWIPQRDIDVIRQAMHDGYQISGTEVAPILNIVKTKVQPPTFHRTNKFTHVFQSIVDSYGIASYREVNPAPYTIITFPFIFAVMFGDAAHGLILLLAGLFFIFNEKKITSARIQDEIFNTFFNGRYLIVLMGLFSIYTGTLYNDAFAKSVNVFGSSWSSPYNDSEVVSWIKTEKEAGRKMDVILDPTNAYDAEVSITEMFPTVIISQRGPYPWGVDPIWNIAENRLIFLNSMKMKASVLLGIIQMTFGLFLSLLNFIHERSLADIFFNFLPQLIFMSCIFVYLCIQIVIKWIFFSAHPDTIFGMDYPGPNCAPSLLINLINMFMLKSRPLGYYDEKGNIHQTCYLNQWYPQESLVELILLTIAMCCVPIMLFGKPLASYFAERRRKALLKKGVRKMTSGDEVETLIGPPDNSYGVSATPVTTVPSTPATAGVSNSPSANSPPNFPITKPIPRSMPKKPAQEPHSMSDSIVHQAIHSIEFVLGCVSHTASYLRLWALSLAHARKSSIRHPFISFLSLILRAI
ncbi:hypothetical protein WR25_10033 isoform C [Diploscapter pachys]|uniref:V-type proton ATPase subunit a n=1 Tax=Diploscapter pachys TaxID=2018661 RepID=A0A2A2JAI9_9BILA|nr:hypothetical protein WR25_10033 isoform C [Diploscapter pachys]